MNEPRRSAAWAFGLLLAASTVLLGCGRHGGPNPDELGSVRAAVSFTPADGVSAVRIDVSQNGALVMTRTVPIPSTTPVGGPAADAFFVLPPGTYAVTATALDAAGGASKVCMSATTTAQVAAGKTTEVTLALRCGGPGNGGLDVIVTAEHAPLITNLVFDPNKFALACQPVTIAVTASSPEGLPLSYGWSVGSTPAGVQLPAGVTSLLVPSGNTAVVDTATPGDYEFSVAVTDTNGQSASLTFPLHILADKDCVPAAPQTPPVPLPDPPREKGCYVYLNNAWQPTVCLPAGYAESHFGHPAVPVGLSSDAFLVGSMTEHLPLVFAQNQATFQAVESETDQFVNRGNGICPMTGSDTPNALSIQDNTNGFIGNNGDTDAIQYTIQSNGSENAVCVWNIDVTTQDYHPTCVSRPQRSGGFQEHDSANISGSVDSGANTVAVVADLSWTEAGQPTLYSVVTDDTFGLAGQWFQFDGAVIGLGNCSNALFTNTWIEEILMTSSCPGDTTMGSPVCPPPLLQPHVSLRNTTGTLETNNLTVITPANVGYLNADLAVTTFDSTTSGFDVTRMTEHPPTTGVLCPQTLVNGDREFGGNGPQITVQAASVIAPDQKSFTIKVGFDAVETGGDLSRVVGQFETFTWFAPAGQHITSILSGSASSVSALSAAAGPEFGLCGDGDVIASPTITGDLIAGIELIGDTGGDDISDDADCHCDTQIKSITFNAVTVQLAHD